MKIESSEVKSYEDFLKLVKKQDDLNKELILVLLNSIKVLRFGSRKERKEQAEEIENIFKKWELC